MTSRPLPLNKTAVDLVSSWVLIDYRIIMGKWNVSRYQLAQTYQKHDGNLIYYYNFSSVAWVEESSTSTNLMISAFQNLDLELLFKVNFLSKSSILFIRVCIILSACVYWFVHPGRYILYLLNAVHSHVHVCFAFSILLLSK